MPKKYISKFCTRLFFMIGTLAAVNAYQTLYAAEVTRPIELHLTVDSGTFSSSVLEVSLDGQNIALNGGPGNTLRSRVEQSFSVMPGTHTLKWKTGKLIYGRPAEVMEDHERVIHVRRTDQVIDVRIRGNTLSLENRYPYSQNPAEYQGSWDVLHGSGQ